MFYVAFLILALACSLIMIRTLVGYTTGSFTRKLLTALFVILCWTAPLQVSFLRHIITSPSLLLNIYSTVSYTFFGYIFILFCLMILRDLLWYVLYGVLTLFRVSAWSLNPQNINMLSRTNRILLVLAALISVYGLYEGMKLPRINEVTISSPLIKEDLRAVHISDLHIDRATPRAWIRSIVKQINSLKPDVIFMTGDIIDDNALLIDDRLSLLVELGAPYGIYSAMGNHELYHGINSWSYKFKELGFQTLFNRGMFINNSNIFVSGIPDSYTASSSPSYNVNFRHALQGSKLSNYKILLSHNPELIDNLTRINYNLMLSGHTHGGQIFPFHLLIKKANRYLSGHYPVNGIDLYVSNGAGTWGPTMRLFSPAEITVFNLQSAPETEQK